MAKGGAASILTGNSISPYCVPPCGIVGEAATRMTPAERAQYGEIPWEAMVGLRNRLIHGYDSVDFDILWQIVTKDLPPLIKSLEKILG